MEPVAEPWAMRRVRERLASAYPAVANTVARNSRGYDGRPACVGNNSCQPICPVNAQYLGINAVEAAEAAGAKVIPDAVVYRIEHDAKGRIAAVHYYSPDKTDTVSPASSSSSPRTASKARSCCCRPATNTRTGWPTAPAWLVAT